MAEAANVHGTWSKEKCKEIIQAAEALPELTSKQRITYLTALDENDYPDWFRIATGRDEECDAADERD